MPQPLLSQLLRKAKTTTVAGDTLVIELPFQPSLGGCMEQYTFNVRLVNSALMSNTVITFCSVR